MSSTWSRKSQSWYTRRPKGNPVVASPPPPLGDLIDTLGVNGLEKTAKEFKGLAQIGDVQTVTSYNWIEKSNCAPSILVPGKPPLWTPQAHPYQLKEDSGSYFRDKNAARYPKHPIEPAVVASLAADPVIPAKIDIFACGSTIGNLLRFIRGQDKTFRMLVYTIRNTIFLVRRENSPTERIPDVRGYGHTFPEANTTWEADVKGSASHQRLIRYNFGGLSMVVRFEADGYIQPGNLAKQPKSSPPTKQSETSIADLTAVLSSATVTPTTFSATSHSTLNVTHGGTLIPQSSIYELKTRSIYTRFKKDHLAEELPRLWVSQNPTLILAFHTQGLFKTEDIEIKDVKDDVERWEKEHADELAKLAALLHWVRDVVEDQSDKKVEICVCEGGNLEVRRQLEDAGEVLSDGVREAWENAGVEGQGAKEGKGEGDNGGSKEEEGAELEWDDEDENDFTACSDACGYCGRCTY